MIIEEDVKLELIANFTILIPKKHLIWFAHVAELIVKNQKDATLQLTRNKLAKENTMIFAEKRLNKCSEMFADLE